MRLCQHISRAPFAAIVLTACGCSAEDGAALPPARDASGSDSVQEAATDGTQHDAGADAGAAEAGHDAGNDTNAEAAPDAGADASDDAMDASFDATPLEAEAGPVPLCLECMQLRVGAPSIVIGPTSTAADNVLVARRDPQEMLAFTANGTTYLLKGPSLEALSLVSDPAVIAAGAAGSFDECGAWLQAVEDDGAIVRGFYHAEEKCDYSIGQTRKSVAYAESNDGARTFTKRNYPGNQIITGSNVFAPGTSTGSGDHGVIRWHGDYWMYYIDWNDPWGTALAKAPGDSGGMPGAWLKWHNGSFGEPGLGGTATTLGWFGTAVSRFVPADRLVLPVNDVAFGGIKLQLSADGFAFQPIQEPLLILEEESWDRKPESGELFAYISMVGLQGGREWSDGFYLFYTYLQPGEDFSQRYLVRRKVDVEVAAQPASPQVRVALSRYFSDANKDHWVTTAAVASHAFEFVLGYLFTKDLGSMTPLWDCYIPSWDDHMVAPGDCGAGAVKLRTLGWVYSTQQPGTIPLYRCYYPDWTDHWVSTTPCDETPGVTNEFVLGYAMGS